MNNQDIVNTIKNTVVHLAISQVTPDDENRLVVAQNIIDRLFISNCITVAEMTNLIKNELTVTLNLSEQETETLLKQYEITRIMVEDKLKISKLKQTLFKVKDVDTKITRMIRKPEIEELSKYLVDSNFISNQKLLYNFIINDLCNHFKLTYEEKSEISREVKKWMRKNLKPKY